MNDLKERAIKYAEVKVKEALTSAIAQAYIDGYSAGWKEREDGTSVVSNAENVKFIDLGLPSGTLWAEEYLHDSNHNLIYLPYGAASKLNIPSLLQWEELKRYCKFEYQVIQRGKKNVCFFVCTGKNGHSIKFEWSGNVHAGQNIYDRPNSSSKTQSWLNSSSDNHNCFFIRHTKEGAELSELSEFIGYSLPVMIVK